MQDITAQRGKEAKLIVEGASRYDINQGELGQWSGFVFDCRTDRRTLDSTRLYY